MIHDHNRDYLDFIGFCDIRPSQQERAVKEFAQPQGVRHQADAKKLKQYADNKEMLADPDVEVVVIALPLHLHAPVAIEAMKAGKHVFCEKLMAHNVGECKEISGSPTSTNKLLAIGHQRHYSVLYDNANYLVQNGLLGDIRHIRALWHRNNASPQHRQGQGRQARSTTPRRATPSTSRTRTGTSSTSTAGSPPSPTIDKKVDFAKYGYKSLDELVRWRLYNRTGAGLMAELGSHQLDACSIFLGKKHPLAVTGIGGTFFYTDGREVDDHVFVTFEFPGKNEPQRTDHVVVTYSSINTNSFEKYGEMRDGHARDDDRRGGEGNPPLQGERRHTTGLRRLTSITMETKARRQAGDRGQPEHGGPIRRVVPGGPGHRRPLARLPRGARALRLLHPPRRRLELPRRHRAPAPLPRRGRPGRRRHRPDQQPRHEAEARIEFDERWFDYKSPEVPEGGGGDRQPGLIPFSGSVHTEPRLDLARDPRWI